MTVCFYLWSQIALKVISMHINFKNFFKIFKFNLKKTGYSFLSPPPAVGLKFQYLFFYIEHWLQPYPR